MPASNLPLTRVVIWFAGGSDNEGDGPLRIDEESNGLEPETLLDEQVGVWLVSTPPARVFRWRGRAADRIKAWGGGCPMA